MFDRRLRTGFLATLLLANTLLGGAKVLAFVDRYRAEKEIESAELNEAFDHLNASLRWSPGDAPTYILIARATSLAETNGIPLKEMAGYTPAQRLGAGIAALGHAIALNPADSWAWFTLAEMYRSSAAARARLEKLRSIGDPAAAGRSLAAGLPVPNAGPEDVMQLAAAQMAVDLDPDFYFYHDFLAAFYRARGLDAIAREEARKSFALFPALEGHGALMKPGAVEDLAQPILAGLEEAGANEFIPAVTTASARAIFLEMIERYPESIAAYQDLARIGGEPYVAESELSIARILQKQEKYRESIPYLNRLIESDSESPRATAAFLLRGIAHAHTEEHKLAVADLRKYLARSAGDAGIMMMFAEQLAKMGQPAEAEKVYAGLVKAHREDPDVYGPMIRFLMERRRWSEARVYAEELRQRAPDDPLAETLLREIEVAEAGRYRD